MFCPKCGSEKVNVQMVSEAQLAPKHHGILWWVFIGWWWLPFKWLFFPLLALLAKIFAPKRQKIITSHKSMCVCQNCGYSWNAQ